MNVSLAGGWLIFAIFVVVFTVAVIFSLYTRLGSAINQRPWNHADGTAPGARGASVLHHDESAARYYTRGTRGRAARHVRPRRLDVGRHSSVAAEEIFTRD